MTFTRHWSLSDGSKTRVRRMPEHPYTPRNGRAQSRELVLIGEFAVSRPWWLKLSLTALPVGEFCVVVFVVLVVGVVWLGVLLL